MVKRAFVLSNNPSVWSCFPQSFHVEGTLQQVLLKAREFIHQGSILVTHPLAGSIKPNQTPYKSLVLTISLGQVDLGSLELIEAAVSVCDKFPPSKRKWADSVIRDFQLIDLALLQSAVESLSADLILEK